MSLLAIVVPLWSPTQSRAIQIICGPLRTAETNSLAEYPAAKLTTLSPQERKEQILFPPHFTRDIDREFQLGPLLVFGEDVAFFGRGKTTLRR